MPGNRPIIRLIGRGLCPVFGLLLGLVPIPLAAQEPNAPLSAIDWLSQSVAEDAPRVDQGGPVAEGGALPEDVAVSTLDGPTVDGAGLLSPDVSGLPRDLWGIGLEADILAALAAEQGEPLPALQALILTVLLAEAQPPVDSAGDGRLLVARVDKLLDLGALDQADALIKAAGAASPDVFRRGFDVALLTGKEDQGCTAMNSAPHLAPTFPARIFCLARASQWDAAALTLHTAQALDQITPEEDALLSRFLDPEYDGDLPLPPVPDRISPLTWRMYEAIGEPLGTSTLPLAFAHAELRDTVGWKAQIEAAERLSRAGAVSPNLLLGLYTEQMPSASGGVWDRVEAFQQFEVALTAKDPQAISETLPLAYAQMVMAELEVPFARLFAAPLWSVARKGTLSPESRQIAMTLALLSQDRLRLLADTAPATDREAFLLGLSNGLGDAAPAPDSLGRTIAPVFADTDLKTFLDQDLAKLHDEQRIGEALLLAVRKIGSGLTGELSDVAEGLAFLRLAGLENVARDTALQLMLLERRG